MTKDVGRSEAGQAFGKIDKDTLQAVRVDEESFDAYWEMFSAQGAPYLETDKAGFKAFLLGDAKGEREGFLYKVQDEPVAVIFVSYNSAPYKGKPNMYLMSLYVKEDFRRQGIAKAIGQHILGVAKDANCYALQWDTEAENGPSLKMFESLGVEETPRTMKSFKYLVADSALE